MDEKAQGDELYRLGQHEQAASAYSAGLLRLRSQLNDLKAQKGILVVLLNRAQCYLSLRLYDEGISDLCQVLEEPEESVSPLLRVKALLRRAHAYEKIGSFAKGITDLETAQRFGLSKLGSALVSSAAMLDARLRRLQADDSHVLQAEGVPALLVTDAQSLRLSFAGEIPRVVHLDTTMFFSLCIGNEFGLWNRSLNEGIDGTSTNFVKWEVFPLISDLELEHADGHDGYRELKSDGRARIRLRFVRHASESSLVCPPRRELIIKFSLNAPLTSGAVVVPVCSLPITVVSCFSDEEEKLFAETKINTEAGQRGQFLSCIRSINLGQGGETIFGYEAQGSLGIGGKLWDSTWVLVDYLESNPAILRDLNVLELGAGTGIAGIAVNSACGCKSMVLTDLPEVCELLHMNVSLNEKLRMQPTQGRVSVMPLSWGQESLPVGNNPDFGVNSEEEIGGIDAIIASDVVYDPEGYAPLAKTLRSLISGRILSGKLSIRGRTPRGTFCILAHRSRHPEEHKFFAMITEEGSGLRMSRISTGFNRTNESPLLLLSDVQLFRIDAIP